MITIRRSLAAAVTAAALGIAGASVLAQPADAAPSIAATTTSQHSGQRLPAVAVNWAAAWNGSDSQRLANLFTKAGARYTDHAFDRTYTGRAGIAQWHATTKQFVQDAKIVVTDAFADCDHASISWTFSGQLLGAPKPFSVPVATVLRLRGHEILTNDDYYNMADVLSQSGLPADTVLG